jgi:hypothetical protein
MNKLGSSPGLPRTSSTPLVSGNQRAFDIPRDRTLDLRHYESEGEPQALRGISWITEVTRRDPQIAATLAQDARFQELLCARPKAVISALTARLVVLLSEACDRRSLEEIALDD